MKTKRYETHKDATNAGFRVVAFPYSRSKAEIEMMNGAISQLHKGKISTALVEQDDGTHLYRDEEGMDLILDGQGRTSQITK